ncbi:MAG: CARDB domain-containing protein [Flavisolibacter sp.]
MKKVFTTIITFLYVMAQAQQPYPVAPPAAGNINAIEYFIDAVPGFGNGTSLTGFSASQDVNGFAGTVNVTAIPSGFHRIYFRTRDANGKWSLASNSYFDNYNVPVYATAAAAPANINKIEYLIDPVAPFGNGTALPGVIPSTDINSLSASIDLSGMNPGYHRIFFRSKNDHASQYNFAIFDNSSSLPYPVAPPPVTNIVQLEYFIDNHDLGFGNCTPIAFTPGTDLSNLNANINVTGLLPGVHRLHIRAKDANGKWSITNFSVFDNSSANAYPPAPPPLTNIVQLEYFIDNHDLGFGNCSQIPFTPGTDLASLSANMNIAGLAAGVHRLQIRGKDANGKWSLTNLAVFDNSAANAYPTAPVPASPIATMEYYIDSDPGVGNATAIPLTPATDINNLSVSINTTGLTSGHHNLYIRSKNSSGSWSLTNIDSFAVGLLQVTPDTLQFLTTLVNSNSIKNIAITNTGSTDQTITGINVPAPFSVTVSTPITITAGQTYNLPVTFSPTAAQSYQNTIELQTSAGAFNVLLKGTGLTAIASWTIAPAGGHDYNNVAINSSNNFLFTVSNTGNVPITLSTATISNPAFVPGYTPGTIIPVNGNTILPVLFTPTTVTTYSGELKIKSNTPLVDSVTTIVTGNGYAPGAPPVLQFVTATPFNGSSGVSPAVGQTGPYTYKILYKSVNNLAPQAGFPKIGIDLNGDQNFNGLGEGIYTMTKEGVSTDYMNGVVYSFTFNHVNNSSTLGYRFIAEDANGNIATTVDAAYVSGPVITDQVLDLKIFANNITYSVPNPNPGQPFTLTAMVSNSTALPAINVPVKFYKDTALLDSAVIPLVGPFSTTFITKPFVFATEGFYPIKVFVNPDQTLPESNYLNNYAIRPIIVGNPILPGGITVSNSASVQLCPQVKIINSGHAVYFGTALPTAVAGAQVTINTGAGIITTTTDVNGNFSYELTGITCGGNTTYTISVTDFTFTSSLLTVSTNVPCPGPTTCVQPPSQGGITAAAPPDPCAALVGSTPVVNFILKYRDRDISNMWGIFDEIMNDTLKVFKDGVLFETFPSADFSHGPGNTVSIPVSILLSTPASVAITAELKYTYVEYFQIPTSIYHGVHTDIVQTGGVTILPLSAKPDLTIGQFTQAGFTAFQFNDVNLNCNAAGSHTVHVFDSIPGGTLTLIKTTVVPSIGGKGSFAISFSDINMSPGVHFIKIITDDTGIVAEEDETNNAFTTFITVPAPDLTVSKISVTPTAVSPGSSVVFKATIKNSGKHCTGFLVRFEVNGVQIGAKKSVSSLNEKDAVEVTSDPFTVTNAENTCGPLVTVTADSDAAITESDETNNSKTIAFSADISPFQLANEIGSAGNPVVVRVNTSNQFFPAVRNIGTRDVNNVSVSFALNGNNIVNGTIANIKAGEIFAAHGSFTHTFTTPGDFIVTVNADTANLVCESDEANNSGTFHIRVTDSNMDFEVLSQYISPSSLNPNIGQAISFVGTVKNTGNKETTPNVIRFLVDDIQLGADVPVNGLLPGHDTTVVATALYSSIIPGIKIMRLVADPANLVAEEREDNNEATRALIVGDAPDMAKASANAITFNPTGFKTGDLVLVSYSIKNNGASAGTAWVRFTILDEGDAITAIDSVQFTLAAGASTIISKKMRFDIDKGTVLAQIVNCSPIEFDLSNNDDALPFSTLVMLTNNITVNTDLDMNQGLPAQLPGWIGGKIVLGNYDLIVNGTILNYDTAHFVITNGSGRLKLNNASAVNTFPIGTNLYSTNFLKINNTGTPDNYSVRLLPYVLKNGLSGDTVLTGNVKLTWLIEEQTIGGSNASVEMFWNAADEMPGFLRADCKIAHYTSSWELGTAGVALTDTIGRLSRSQGGYTSLSPFTVTTGVGVALPLRLLDFTVERKGAAALLQWKTADEINTRSFTIQYSRTGQQFNDVGNVNARNDRGTNSYQFVHTGINEGPNYYRLKMIDIDGRFTYSPTKLISLDKAIVMQVYPDPVQGVATVMGLKPNGVLKLLSLDGKMLQQWTTAGNSKTINLGTFAAGVYLIQFQYNGEEHVVRIVKQ